MSTQESSSEQGASAQASLEHGTSEERPGPTNVGEMKPPSHPLGRRMADRWGPDDLTHESVEKLRLEIKSLRRAGITTAASVVGALTALFGAYLQSSVSKAERTLAQLEVAQAKY